MNKSYFQTIYQIILTGHWITDKVSQELKEFGITEPQFNVLRILKGSEGQPISVHEISGKMIQRNSNVTRIIDKLLVKELVIREACPSNRRKMDISITEKGKSFLKILNRRVEDFHAPMMQNLTEEELKTLKRLIIKLKSNINE